MQDEPGVLANYSTVHIDWRWEMLSRALNKLVPIFEVLLEKFDLQKFLQNEDGKVDVQTAKLAHAAINTPDYVSFCEMVRSAGVIIDRAGHRLEGCECHREILIAKTSSRQKKRTLTRSLSRCTLL